MIIKPKIRGFICTTAHPTGCDAHVKAQIDYIRAKGPLKDGPKRVLVIGASTGYGLASRIEAAFGSDAATIGVFFEKPGTEKKTGTAGWYNSAAFDKYAKAAGLYAKSINGDAFSNEVRAKVIELIKEDLGTVDCVVYSLASPVRKLPETGEVVRSALKTIGETYTAPSLDTNKNEVIKASVEPATAEEISDTITVMGGQDWELWMKALDEAGVLAENVQTVAYSYIGTAITWPMYWHGTLGKAKEDVERAAREINAMLEEKYQGHAAVAVLKSVVTQASSAIPVMPLYISAAFRVMKELDLHEDCIEQIQRLFATCMYGEGGEVDESGRFRLDDWELKPEVQSACELILKEVKTDSIDSLTDYKGYKENFERLFGFGLAGVDYEAEVSPIVEFDVIEMV
ncbi:trans-2-enoyl-CoA reductase [Wohlfahrtiimonas chitiniclastica]|uniref:enoyl-ACP reductase FabV n=1 Tax=Wohlfahrtiimonas chitiniclastica TaxID=400946 RepID=UPI000B998202|nr:enoyl-ACP reductase FabV [Wohlfahrtiimonas chitiniclastica]OYQ69658.1 trans-2-enoyl-CoA reductase [Wohlfahrtiimonas chitiniclastica]OYQ81067.1 trans-2-enoyl-CoA reductase [Wohlfahrtiimonas chitiniclastica]